MAQGEGDANGRFRVLSAGTLIRVKGFGLAIKAFDEFSQRNPESTFTIIGSGPEEAKLRALSSSLKSGGRIRLVPHISRDDLLVQMAAHDVFLFPSLRDGGGAVVIEAMAAGKPVVCLDNGGPGMHVTGDSGIKIVPRSVEETEHELAMALERLYLDEGLRLKLGQAARQKAIEEYHWDRLGEQLMEIYDQAIGSEATAKT